MWERAWFFAQLNCPALEGVYLSEPKDIEKLLCSPSPHRLDILEWICISVYPPLQQQFSSLKESESDVKIKEMAKLGYELMLSQANDLDLIAGNASARKQLHFLEQLLAAVSDESDLPLSDLEFFSTEEYFQEIVKKNEEFVKQVFYSPDLQAVLNPECHPWSSDIKPLLVGKNILPKRVLRSAASHERTLTDLLKQVEDAAARLEGLRAQCSFLQEDPAGTDSSYDSVTALQTFKLIASDFHQLLVAFEQVYENELKHCERPAPRLSPCGPLFQAVHQGLLLCVKELQSLAQVMETSKLVVERVKQRHGEKTVWSGSAKVTLPSKLEELQQRCKAIHTMLEDCQLS
ncbi:HAUS augmin-like complex subunit 7 isoform X2 [Varanus komodoensis]|uniref:HAUS augmin-like complex subunit 7 isoform X2 n=1 Tax=Varanus komodoensis TaxID=61221 RepID=UPI001CF7CA40|nr:HAUS augmin-like complex subunit 7 isoform X2 [Varanus komodoensis]